MQICVCKKSSLWNVFSIETDMTLGQVEKIEIVHPHAACKFARVEQQMLLEDERDKHERAKHREQQRKRQSLLDHRGALESQSRLSNSTFNSSFSY